MTIDNVPEILLPPSAPGIPVRLTVLSLVQVNVVPKTPFGLEITIVVIGVPEQTV